MKISPFVRKTMQADLRDIKKCLTSSSGPDWLSYEEADRFISTLVDLSTVTKFATVVKMTKDRKRIREIAFGSGFLRPGSCGDCTETLDIEHSQRWLEPEELDGVACICDDFIEDNLEGENFVDKLMGEIAKEVDNESEWFAMMASLDGRYVPAGMRADTMALIDGWYMDALNNGHVLDALSAGDGRCITDCKLKEMLQMLPAKYKKNRNNLIFVMADNLVDDLAFARSTRPGSAQRAYDYIERYRDDMEYGGVPIVRVPLLPVDMATCGSASVSPADGTFVILTTRQNFLLAIHRAIKYERLRKCGHETDHIISLRVDAKFANPDAVVLYDCLHVCSCD